MQFRQEGTGWWLTGLILEREPVNKELIDFPLLKDKVAGDPKLALQLAANKFPNRPAEQFLILHTR